MAVRTRLLLALVAMSGALLACNAILGVEDVTLKEKGSAGTGEDGDEEEGKGSSGRQPGGGLQEVDADTPGGGDVPRPALALGMRHGCARLLAGTVRCWGENGDGQLGLGVAFDAGAFAKESLEPKDVPGVGNVVALASGLYHSCAVHQDGTVSCWGWNPFGQLGDGTKLDSVKPVKVAGIGDAVAVACGNAFTCVARKDKTVACWGANSGGQVGDGTTTDRVQMVPVKNLTGVVALATGYTHACALHDDATVSCWGGNRNGQLGLGNTTDQPAPTKVGTLSKVVQVVAAQSTTCVRIEGGAVSCWGDNGDGQLGNGSANVSSNPNPTSVSGLSDATYVWVASSHACAVKRDATVVCWGSNSDGQLGGGKVVLPDASAPKPQAVQGLSGAFGVWVGGDRSCALTTDGKGYCWGDNARGQLGDGTQTTAYGPSPLKNPP